MLVLSLAINVAVLVPVLWGLISDSPGSASAFGPDEPARRILISVYCAIALLSAVLLAWPAGRPTFGPGLLSLQVVYKIISVVALGPAHPVAMANLGIAAVHSITLWVVLR
ncbi:MAG: hypothetical protein AAF919_06435 [Pseudomonadota bacterium]